MIFCLLVCFTHAAIIKKSLKELYNKYLAIDFDFESGSAIGLLKEKNNMFYQLVYQKGFNEQTITKDIIFLIWLQVGPGCSSQSAFYELNGPFHIEKSDADFTIRKKDNSWNDFASILFVDRPFELDLAKGIYQLIQHCKLQVILQNLWLNSSRFLPNSNWLKLTLLDSVTQVTLLLYFRIVCLIVTSSLIIKDLQLKMDYKVCYIELRQHPHTYM